jgi:putative ABC transport system permease protein
MSLTAIAIKNVRRAPLRALLTVLSVAISLVAVLMLRSVSAGYTERVTQTPNNRVVSRHKVGWSQAMPVHYTDEVRKIEGVKTAMGARFPALKHPSPDKKWFQSLAVDARPFMDMHYELDLPDEQKRAFTSDRNSALISAQLAEELGWQLGDRIQLKSAAFPGLFEFNVAGVYRSTRHGFAERTVFCHYEYFNEELPEQERDKIELISAQIHDPTQGARIAKAIDIRFDERDNQTYTMEDKAMNASFVGMFGAILEAIDAVSMMILGIVLLIVGNGVRARKEAPRPHCRRVRGWRFRLRVRGVGRSRHAPHVLRLAGVPLVGDRAADVSEFVHRLRCGLAA